MQVMTTPSNATQRKKTATRFAPAWTLVGALVLAASAARAQDDAAERRWDLEFANLFKDGTKPLIVYAREQDGNWLTGVGSSRDPAGRAMDKTFNRSWYCTELSGAPLHDGRMKGTVVVYLTPDGWMPKEGHSLRVELAVDAEVDGETLKGTYRRLTEGETDSTIAALGKEGMLTGKGAVKANKPLPEPMQVTLNLQGAVPGGDPEYLKRCIVVQLDIVEGRLTAARYEQFDPTAETMDPVTIPLKDCTLNTVSTGPEGLQAKVRFDAITCEMDNCAYEFDIRGRFLDSLVVGTFNEDVTVPGEPALDIEGSFDGKVFPLKIGDN